MIEQVYQQLGMRNLFILCIEQLPEPFIFEGFQFLKNPFTLSDIGVTGLTEPDTFFIHWFLQEYLRVLYFRHFTDIQVRAEYYYKSVLEIAVVIQEEEERDFSLQIIVGRMAKQRFYNEAFRYSVVCNCKRSEEIFPANEGIFFHSDFRK